MKWHNFDTNRLISLMLPVRFRRLHFVLWLYALLTPLRNLVETIRYRMQHDGRVIYLEKVLNEYFEIPNYNPSHHETSKVIFLDPGEIPDEVYIYQVEEPDTPPYLSSVMDEEDGDLIYLFTQSELEQQYSDFKVVVPSYLESVENRIRSVLDYYKLAGKKYKIIYI